MLAKGGGDRDRFQPRTDIPVPLKPGALTVGDLNGDGQADIAVATEDSTTDGGERCCSSSGAGAFPSPSLPSAGYRAAR